MGGVVGRLARALAGMALAAGLAVAPQAAAQDEHPATFAIDGAPKGLLPAIGSRLLLRATDGDGEAIKLKSVATVRLVGLSPGSRIVDDFGPEFAALAETTSSGAIAFTPNAAFRTRAAGMTDRVLEMRIAAVGRDGAVYDGTARFMLGAFKLSGRVRPSPSAPGMSLKGIRVKASVLGTEIAVQAHTDANGRFSFGGLPIALLNVVARHAREAGGETITYGADRDLLLERDSTLNLKLMSIDDLVADSVPPWPLFGARTSMSAPPGSDEAWRRGPSPGCGYTSLTASVTTGEQDVTNEEVVPFTVQQGQQMVMLEYSVTSAEFPYYVLRNSRFNDFWSVQLATRKNPYAEYNPVRVNQQITTGPTFMTDGSKTSITVRKVIDVSRLTAAGPATLVLKLQARNVGDSQLDTTVNARITSGGLFAVRFDPPGEPADHAGYPNIRDVMSLPANPPPYPGAAPEAGRNTLSRKLRVTVLGNIDRDLFRNLLVRIRPTTGTALLSTLLDTSVTPGAWMKDPDNPSDILLEVASIPPNGALDGIDPQLFFRQFQYEVFTQYSADCAYFALSDPVFAQFRAPPWDASLRTGGKRDAGGDDWMAPAMYRFLEARKASGLPPALIFDDVSGESGHNLKHLSHSRGLDIDVLQFGRYGGVDLGNVNYRMLRDDVARYFASPGSAAGRDAKQRIAAWIGDQRQGILSIANDSRVEKLLVGYGAKFKPHLPERWLERLLIDGKLTSTGSPARMLDLGSKMARPDRLIFYPDHNDHNHITLRDTRN